MSHLTAEAVQVEIKGALYAVEPIDPGFAGVSAVRVTKLVNGEAYDVVRTHDNAIECSCPDFICRHEGKGTTCKHGRAMAEGGHLPTVEAPKPASKPAPAPVTPADLKRASYFGLKLPKVEQPAPAPAVEVAPVVQAPAEPASPDTWDDSDPAGDSWDTWQDDDSTAELGPEAEPIGAAPVDAFMPEATARFLTGMAFDLFEEGRGDEIDAMWLSLDEENRESFRAYLKAIGSPARGWSSWMSLCFSGSPVSFPEEPRPTAPPRFVVIPEDDAYRLGYELGNQGLDASAPKGQTFPWLVAFYDGLLAGRAALDAEARKYDAFLDSLDRQRMEEVFGGPEDTWHESELARAGSRSGHPAFEDN